MARVLIADDDDDFRKGMAETLGDAGHLVIEAEDGREALVALQRERLDMAFIDLRMGGVSGLDVLVQRRERGIAAHLPIVMLTGYADSPTTIEAMRQGAFDHLTKPIGREALLAALDVALAAGGPAAQLAAEAPDEPEARSTRAAAFVGSSGPMHEVQKRIGRATRSEAPVLVTGETGTGKEVVARLLHAHGSRAAGPFVAVNCAAIPADLLESELFGHVKGAFSGASSDRKGRFEQADSGIIFLDEIGDMPLVMQAKLLRVLQDKEFVPVGAATPRRVDVRIVAATHRDLEQAVVNGQFRADLRYRLDVLRIHLPPLRERLADILVLAEHFLKLAAPSKRLSGAAAQRLMGHGWPGNVRELRNVMERAAVGSRGDVLSAADIEIERPGDAQAGASQPDRGPGSAGLGGLSLPEALERLERRMISDALDKAAGNRTEAARMLGIRRQLLYARLAALGIEQSADRSDAP